MGVIETQEVTKIYRTGMRKGDIVALQAVSLDINAGEIFALLGPNGAGKTTLFKVLLGITSITSGKAIINGFAPSDPRSREKVGFLPENHRFPQHLTGDGLLNLSGRMQGLSANEITHRANDLLRLVEMDRWRSTKIGKYSKGMLQRIGLAQAMVADPEILFLDEPTDGVDPVGRVEIRGLLTRIKEQGHTIVLNSHLLSEVEAVADRVAILQRGSVLKTATVEVLTHRQSQYEVEAKMGSKLIEIEPDVGKIVAVTSQGLLVELTDPENINVVIDKMRMKGISLRAVKPVTVSLEQSFIEAVSEPPRAEES